MPDLHPGKYGPVGCSILADRIHPQLVGSDIGCGMGLFQLDLAVRKLRVDKAAGRLRALDLPWDGNVAGAMAELPIDGRIVLVEPRIDPDQLADLRGAPPVPPKLHP